MVYGGGPIRVGLPPVAELEFFGDDQMRRAHLAFRDRLVAQTTTVEVSLAPFLAAGELRHRARQLPGHHRRIAG